MPPLMESLPMPPVRLSLLSEPTMTELLALPLAVTVNPLMAFALVRSTLTPSARVMVTVPRLIRDSVAVKLALSWTSAPVFWLTCSESPLARSVMVSVPLST